MYDEITVERKKEKNHTQHTHIYINTFSHGTQIFWLVQNWNEIIANNKITAINVIMNHRTSHAILWYMMKVQDAVCSCVHYYLWLMLLLLLSKMLMLRWMCWPFEMFLFLFLFRFVCFLFILVAYLKFPFSLLFLFPGWSLLLF